MKSREYENAMHNDGIRDGQLRELTFPDVHMGALNNGMGDHGLVVIQELETWLSRPEAIKARPGVSCVSCTGFTVLEYLEYRHFAGSLNLYQLNP